MMILVGASAAFSVLHSHRWTAIVLVVLAAGQLYSLWNNYWEITQDAQLISKAYGMRRNFSVACIRYAGTAREYMGFPVTKNNIELELDLEGSRVKCCVRVAHPSGFLEELSRVFPQTYVVKMR